MPIQISHCALLLIVLIPTACGPSNASQSGTTPTTPARDETPAATSAAPAKSSSAKTESKPGAKTFFIRETLADCEGEGPMKCMQVRESESDEWTLFYGSIEGFKYEESYAYELKVAVETLGHAPADASSLRHRLVEVVSKRKVNSK